jgi:hypothetical protein
LAGVIWVRAEYLVPPGSRPGIGQSPGTPTGVDNVGPDLPLWRGQLEAKSGRIDSKQIRPSGHVSFNPNCWRLLFTGMIAL